MVSAYMGVRKMFARNSTNCLPEVSQEQQYEGIMVQKKHIEQINKHVTRNEIDLNSTTSVPTYKTFW